MHTVYIIYSPSCDKYYCGETSDFDDRFNRHNKGYSKYTKPCIPWELVRKIEVSNRAEARKLEIQIKKRGIKRFLDENSF